MLNVLDLSDYRCRLLISGDIILRFLLAVIIFNLMIYLLAYIRLVLKEVDILWIDRSI